MVLLHYVYISTSKMHQRHTRQQWYAPNAHVLIRIVIIIMIKQMACCTNPGENCFINNRFCFRFSYSVLQEHGADAGDIYIIHCWRWVYENRTLTHTLTCSHTNRARTIISDMFFSFLVPLSIIFHSVLSHLRLACAFLFGLICKIILSRIASLVVHEWMPHSHNFSSMGKAKRATVRLLWNK